MHPMKNRSVFVWLAAVAALAAGSTYGEPPKYLGSTQPVVVQRGPHHRVWQKVDHFQAPNGRVQYRTNSYVELATGMHHLVGDQWVESKEEIELFQDGAIARQGQHQVIFAPNLNTAGAIDLLSADGKRFRSTVLGLCLYDTASGRSLLLAEVKDSIGAVRANQVIYRDAFTDAKADLRYTYTRRGFEQDVILRERFALPEGFDPATTRLEIWTEFLEPPSPVITPRLTQTVADETLDFGAMRIGSGRAFSMAIPELANWSTRIGKSWRQVEGRMFLIESVPWRAIQAQLARLPAPGQAALPKKSATAQLAKGDLQHRTAPPARPAKRSTEKMRLASLAPPAKGLVLDYETLISTNYLVLQGDTTYYVSGPVLVDGLVIEGGTVAKYARGASIRAYVVDCRTAPYRPAIFTAEDDASVGDTVGTGELGGYYADIALDLIDGYYSLKHLRISYANLGIRVADVSLSLKHSQITMCQQAFELAGNGGYFGNLLIHSVGTVLSGGYYPSSTFEHLTLDGCESFSSSTTTNSPICLTNSLLSDLGGWGNAQFFTNAVSVANGSSPFQTVGAASHYLAPASPYRNVGTTSIDAQLALELKSLTTYPPLVLTNPIASDATLAPQAQRDTDLPDLGYHYPPLDYAVSFVQITNATLTLTNGAAVATFGNVGFLLDQNSHLISEGAPQNLNHFTRYFSVQEQAVNWGDVTSPSTMYTIYPSWSGTVAPSVRFRFSAFEAPGKSGWHLYGWASPVQAYANLLVRDCQFFNSEICLWENGLGRYAFTNTLFDRVATQVIDPAQLDVCNALFRGQREDSYLYQANNNGTWTFQNNLLDNSEMYGGFLSVSRASNAFYYSTNFPTTASDLILTNLAYETGPLGDYYQPTSSPLTNRGSVANAGMVGFYHYTTTTDQVKEENSRLDIGFHYVAVDVNGNPIDSDGEGLADYQEDANGNGLTEAWETYFDNPNSDGDDANDWVEVHQGRNPRDSDVAGDPTGQTQLRVFTPLK